LHNDDPLYPVDAHADCVTVQPLGVLSIVKTKTEHGPVVLPAAAGLESESMMTATLARRRVSSGW
jgi:hypothetical protein